MLTLRGIQPVTRPSTAALVAAVAQAPVVKPLRSGREGTGSRPSNGSGSFGSLVAGSPSEQGEVKEMRGRVFVAAGTSEAKEVARFLTELGYEVVASVRSPEAASALRPVVRRVEVGARDEAGFRRLFEEEGVVAVVDAAHPFALRLRAALARASAGSAVPYLRYEREESLLPRDPRIWRLTTLEEAARLAPELGRVVFLTTGLSGVETFKEAADRAGVRLVARVLPRPESLARLLAIGFRPQDIVAMQGPFGQELERALFCHVGAEVLVTKESGPRGSVPAKVSAALELGLSVLLVSRPEAPEQAVRSLAELRDRLRVLLR